MTKMTKKEMFAQIKTHLTNPEEIAFIDHEIELLEKKASTPKKPTATQLENEVFTQKILAVLENAERGLSISEIQAKDTTLPTSNQRMSRLLNNLVESHVVVKVYEKRKPFFQMAN
ncbi:hypothetical protein IJ425_07080 [bacterium]|nr:hypothetical protein [bacterium]